VLESALQRAIRREVDVVGDLLGIVDAHSSSWFTACQMRF
jgi:hypothetical protein